MNVDFLLLTKLDEVDLLDDDLLHAVGSICPNLKHAIFNSEVKDDDSEDSFSDDDSEGSFSDDDPDPTEFEIDFSLMVACWNRWPKVRKTCLLILVYIVSIVRSSLCLAYDH